MDSQTLALSALGWILSDDSRAERLLALTGQTPEGLRGALGDSARMTETLAGVLEFLCGHEPDLVGAADALGVEPALLASARERLA